MVLDCVTSLQHGADLLWIETPIPNLSKIASLVSAIRAQVKMKKITQKTLYIIKFIGSEC